jgi:hypothetical protein
VKHLALVAVFCSLFFGVLAQHPESEEGFKDYFIKQGYGIGPLEGIWSVSTTQEYYRFDTLYDIQKFPKVAKVAVMKDGDKFVSYGLAGEPFNVEFSTTDVNGVFLYRNFFPETSQYSKAHAVISKSGEMEYTYEFPDDYLRLKLKSTYEEGTRVVNIIKWTRIFPEQGKTK